jgi:UDP-N-acetylglucosamine 2-epimerase
MILKFHNSIEHVFHQLLKQDLKQFTAFLNILKHKQTLQIVLKRLKQLVESFRNVLRQEDTCKLILNFKKRVKYLFKNIMK